jgi:hypothetical protein
MIIVTNLTFFRKKASKFNLRLLSNVKQLQVLLMPLYLYQKDINL